MLAKEPDSLNKSLSVGLFGIIVYRLGLSLLRPLWILGTPWNFQLDMNHNPFQFEARLGPIPWGSLFLWFHRTITRHLTSRSHVVYFLLAGTPVSTSEKTSMIAL